MMLSDKGNEHLEVFFFLHVNEWQPHTTKDLYVFTQRCVIRYRIANRSTFYIITEKTPHFVTSHLKDPLYKVLYIYPEYFCNH